MSWCHRLNNNNKGLLLLSLWLVPIIDKRFMPEKLKSATRLAVSDGLRISNQNIKFSLNRFGAKLYNDLPGDKTSNHSNLPSITIS